MKLRNQKGFTLIELVLVITVLGILAVAALPQFLNITSNADAAARDGVVGAVRSALAIEYADYLANGQAQPATLDGHADGACTGTGCFGTVLQDPVVSSKWSRANGGLTYTYTPTSGAAVSYTYSPGTDARAGSFQ